MSYIVTMEDVQLPITEETKVICQIVAVLSTGDCSIESDVKLAYDILDEVLRVQEKRNVERLEAEMRRRKGY